MSEQMTVTEKTPDAVKIGDIFYESWGYDQTNIDFAQVVGLTASGKTAICRMMSQRMTESTGWMSEKVVPKDVVGIEFRLLIRQSKTGGKEIYLRGSYPLVQRDDGYVSKRSGWFFRFDGAPVYQSHYA